MCAHPRLRCDIALEAGVCTSPLVVRQHQTLTAALAPAATTTHQHTVRHRVRRQPAATAGHALYAFQALLNPCGHAVTPASRAPSDRRIVAPVRQRRTTQPGATAVL
ncbi:hypothetical protein XCV4385 [Xanthomonas euvesicatoria pv. vesicatoria str. 85-10]|uniref:Uncharacterized protein n=1 Tax=Xanthomonas euvesicatoria pv. vesicatoria (strain 85-10) TaxID=316273 RepID=Q3BM97_XANE5|nr:hypothetical protein XCV4385 [Xanthomonas euvesicatoria pv. vesicatoria str. 85-10]